MATLVSVPSIINYFPQDGPKHVYPGTAGYQRRTFDSRKVQVKDIRGSEKDFSLEKNGFQVAKNNWTEISVDEQNERVCEVVYPETVEFLTKITGATDIVPFSHQIRCTSVEAVKKASEGLDDKVVLPNVGPTTFAHCDNSDSGSLLVLQENIPAADVEKRLKSRWAIMNVWRPLGRPVTREPLAMLEANSVADNELEGVWVHLPEKGKGAFDNIYNANEGFEIAQIRANEQKHQWYYVSNLTPEESLVFKQYDSKRDGRARRTPHSAFQCERDHGPTRQSIEVRCLVFWEGESPS